MKKSDYYNLAREIKKIPKKNNDKAYFDSLNAHQRSTPMIMAVINHQYQDITTSTTH
jgi:hypothetical protein